ncbi:MAG: TonB-dependent receptor [Bacteroidales bacterium]|nr:TonB-dependent receptor [Bacteroidales bacterium]
MKKIIIFAVLFCHFFIVMAQKENFTGRVLEPEKNGPVAFASVGLLRAVDSTVVQSEMTDKEGRFAFSGVPSGKYLIKIYYVGYREWVSEELVAGKEAKDLGDIVLQWDVEQLQSVEVVFKKPLFEQKLGKTIMNVESNPSAAGDNVLELLRKMPGVLVDNNDNISLQGKSGVLILIDDKDPHLSGDDLVNFLKSMPASMIDRVEVMKNPSARYDAAGTSGIINLVTKHVRTNGINGSVWAGASYNGSWGTNEGFNLTGRAGKWVLNGSYYYMYQRSKTGYDGETCSIFQGDTVRQTVNEFPDELWSSMSKFGAHGINFAADCYIDSVNTLSFSYRANLFNADWTSSSKNRIYYNNEVVTSFLNNSESVSKHGNHQINANFKHVFDTLGTTLYADVTYSLDHNKSISDRYQPFYFGDFQTESYNSHYYGVSHPSRMHVATAKLDFEHPFNDRLSLECGVKTSFVRNRNNSVNYLNDSLMESKSNHFIYTENIAAAYIQANFQPDQLVTIQAGLRAEYAHVVGNLVTTGEVNKQDYADVFPSLQIDYQLPKMNTLSFALRSRISRPDYHDLNPFVDIDDSYNMSTGNPYLTPEYTYSATVDYSWHYMLFASVGYSFTRGTVKDILYTDKLTNIKLTKPENIGKSHAMNASLFANIPIGKWWMMMWNVHYALGRRTFEYENRTVSSLVSEMQLFTMHTFTFCKHYSIELGAWWMPRSRNMFGTTKGVFYAWGGFKASFFKDAFTVRLGVQDIFNNNSWVSHSAYPDGTYSNMRWMHESRGVKLDLTYRFGKQNIQMRQRRGHDDEFDRMGGGNTGGQGGQGGQAGGQPMK